MGNGENNLETRFNGAEIKREPTDQRLASILGYLGDCARALLRSAALTDLDSNNISFLPLPPDSLEKLVDDGLVLEGTEELRNLIYKITAGKTQFDLLLGTLFVKGYKGKEDRISRINAPPLFMKLEIEKIDSSSFTFKMKEDIIHLNQSLSTGIVNIPNEEEIEMRFQDLWGAIPQWPLNLELIKHFFQNFNNCFPEVFCHGESIEGFTEFDSVSASRNKYKICPAHALIAAPKQDAQGTIVEEIGKISKEIESNTAIDMLFLESSANEDSASITEKNADSIEGVIGTSFTDGENNKNTESRQNLFPLDLSDTQKKIVLGARKNNLTVVEGPPGTGKSYTSVAVILDHILEGKRVLFVSRMDKAVEVVSDLLEKLGDPYAVARFGTRKMQLKLANKIDSITSPTSQAKKYTGKQFGDNLDKYEKAKQELEKLEKEFTDILDNEKEWALVKEKIDSIETKIQTDENLLNLPIDRKQAEKLRGKISTAGSLVKNKNFFIYTWWGNFILSNIKRQLDAPEETTVEELINRTERIESERQRSEIEAELEKFDDISQICERIQSRKEDLHKHAINNLKENLLGNLHGIIHTADGRQELKKLVKALHATNIRSKSALLKKVKPSTLLNAFPCWATTTYHLSQILPLKTGMFDLVIFDESSQCDLASAVPALYRANRALIVGDPKQLTHVVFLGRQYEYQAFAKNNVPREMQEIYRFSKASLFAVAEQMVSQTNYFMLDEHFRSDPHIIEFSNKKFYRGEIRVMTSRPRPKLGTYTTAIQIEYVNGERTIGTENPKEIEHVFFYIRQFIKQSPRKKPLTIGVLSPFRDQVNAIIRELPKHVHLAEVTRHEIEVGTAHGLQGDERDIVILSLSLDSNFHHGTLQFLEKPNLFNVAITRAKKKMIVLSSVKPEDLPNGLLKDYLSYATQKTTNDISDSVFDSKFEEQVARALEQEGFEVYPQYKVAGFSIDLVIGSEDDWVAVECDGPTHFDMKRRQNFYDVWRQRILERAGWRVIRISYRNWERDSKSCIKRIKNEIGELKMSMFHNKS